MEIKPRISETDMLGHINNASYFVYMEEARLTFLKELGMHVSNGEFTFVLVSTKCNFVRQGYVGQVFDVQTDVSHIGRTSLTLISEIAEKESGKIIAKGEATIVYFDTVYQRAAELPDSFRVKLKANT
ncbi:acyl-CoA thioester hydrolase [Lentibacillus halodurans]|uniref:Acyl-CoA thioester hydrolase n=2 Tax=Lentibacillus halodurans TaxID=237679 RepID=A0A1I0YGD6_9BACI|nr:acyl-CoA thioester hydrolase [Lentibacillus halodurans]